MNSDFAPPSRFKTPEGLRLSHDEARAELVRATLMRGRIGEAASRLAGICLPHFEHEEIIVFPIFGILPELASGKVRPEMAEVLPLLTSFDSCHQTLDYQHQALGAAIHILMTAACQEGNREIIEFCYCLRAHERLDHDVIYPTVHLIGKLVKERLGL